MSERKPIAVICENDRMFEDFLHWVHPRFKNRFFLIGKFQDRIYGREFSDAILIGPSFTNDVVLLETARAFIR